jgi:hypothetical protein
MQTVEQQIANNKQQIVYIKARIEQLSNSFTPFMDNAVKAGIKKQIAQQKRMVTTHINNVVKLQRILNTEQSVA